MAIIVLDAGHGGHDPGAVGKNSKEKDNVLKVVKEVGKILTSKGHKVVYTRSTDVFVNLSERAAIARRNGALIFVSFHDNAAVASATGFETFIFNGATSARTKQLQNNIHSEIMKVIGIRDRGKKSANFAVLRETGINIASVLIEYGFITNLNDEKILINEVSKLSRATAQGILNVVGGGTVSKPSPSKPSAAKPKPAPAKPSTNKVYTGDSIVDYLKSINKPSSYEYRANLAREKKMKNYSGSPADNTKLLALLRSGKVLPTPKPPAKPKPKSVTSNKVLKVGDTVTVNKNATKFANGASMASHVKGSSYKIIQIKPGQVLLSNIVSWVRISDLTAGGSVSKPTPKPIPVKSKAFKVGSKVKIKSGAVNYARTNPAVKIPPKYKGKTFTIQQVGNSDVLIKELRSWVRKADII